MKSLGEAFFGRGDRESIIVLDDVNCCGNEERLTDCPAKDTRHDCNHDEDVGVRCQPSKIWRLKYIRVDLSTVVHYAISNAILSLWLLYKNKDPRIYN